MGLWTDFNKDVEDYMNYFCSLGPEILILGGYAKHYEAKHLTKEQKLIVEEASHQKIIQIEMKMIKKTEHNPAVLELCDLILEVSESKYMDKCAAYSRYV